MCYKETHCGYSSGRAECDFRAHAIYTIFAMGEKAFFLLPSSQSVPAGRIYSLPGMGLPLPFLFTNWHRNHARPPPDKQGPYAAIGRPFPATLVMMGGGGGGMAWYGDKAREIRGGSRKRAHLACADRCEKEFLLSRKCLRR